MRACRSLDPDRLATQAPAYVEAGLRTLRWLMTQQTTSTDCSGRSAAPASANFERRRVRSTNSRWKPPQPLPPA